MRWALGTAVAALLALPCGLVFTCSITRSVSCLAEQVGRIAGGHLEVAVESAGRGDEVDAVAKLVAVLQEASRQVVEAEAARVRAQHGLGDQVKCPIVAIAYIAAAAVLQEQGAATREFARNTGEAAAGTGEVPAQIGRLTGGVGETTAALGELQAAPDDVTRQSETLQARLGSPV